MLIYDRVLWSVLSGPRTNEECSPGDRRTLSVIYTCVQGRAGDPVARGAQGGAVHARGVWPGPGRGAGVAAQTRGARR